MPALLFSQKPGKSKFEKKWALAHPFAAIKVKRIYRQAMPFYNDQLNFKQLDSFSNGGKLDAFRHVFFMAAFTQKVKVKKIRALGQAHEKANRYNAFHGKKEHGEVPDSISTVMDLKNNETGFLMGSSNKKIPLSELRIKAIDLINQGEALIIKRDKNGNYLTCSDQLIDLKSDISGWNTPKCLVHSNLVYKD